MGLNFRFTQKFALVCSVSIALLLAACGGSGGGGGQTTQPPAAPTGFQATAGNGQVMLSWTPSTGATSYSVQRSTTSGGPYTQIATPSGTSYTDSNVTNGTTYYYVVAAVNSAGSSANSAQVSATPAVTVPAAPTGLTATPGAGQVALSWTASTGATSYSVQRSTTSGGPYTQIATPTGTSYTDSSVTNGTTYYYVVAAVNSAGTSPNSSQVSATPATLPAAPTGLQAAAGNAQVSLSWTASTGATSYSVQRSTTNGGPYTQIATPSGTSYTDSSVTNGTTYYYVVAAVNSAGTSANSSQVSATPTASTAVTATLNVLANRHTISPYVYGGAFPASTAAITDTGTTVVRWGGNASSTYNWELGTDNADNDYYFEDFSFGALGNPADSNSTQFIKDVQTAGSNPLMTMVMMNWVAQSPETSSTQGGTDNYHWSFSKSQDYSSQCSFDQYNTDAGDGLETNCSTQLAATTAAINRTYFPLLDDSSESCPSWATAGCASAVYRNTWAAALATAFGSTSTCPIPYFASLTSCHFYDMDNEIDIWGSTHFDIHPNPSGYDELSATYLTEANNLKGWDPQAVRLGPVSCCWWFYWNGANSNDKGAHAGVDFLPWWLNEVYWNDQISGARSLDIFDIHAYPDGPNMSGWTTAQEQAAAVSIYRDYWDPTLVSPSGTIDQTYTTNIQPNKTIAFRIPRMRAIANMIYPGTPLSFTEWSAAFAGEKDFSTALGDADAYGILGRERVSLSTRWEAPLAANPNYQALKLFTNYDGSHHGFGTTSVEATHNANPNLFSVYAALNSAGTQITILVLNKDPANSAQVSFTTTGFSPSGTQTAYTLSQSSPTAITSATGNWSSTQTFAPYTATLLVVPGSLATPPAADWDLNPDTIMVPASGTLTLNPIVTSGTGTVTLSSPVFDAFEGATACTGGSINIGTPKITTTPNGAITVTAPATPGFCHFTVTGTDTSGVGTTQGGWIVVGNPPATFTQTGNNQSGAPGAPLTLSVTLNPGSSGGTASGASVFFSTNAGSLTNVQVGSEQVFTGSKVIAVTNASGLASVTLTLPQAAGPVTVMAEGQYALGHPVATFIETVN